MRHYERRPRVHPPCRVDTSRPVRQAIDVAGRDSKSPEQARLATGVLAARERLRITQEEFAERSGLALKTIQRVEQGQINPRTKTFAGLDQGAGWAPGSASALFRDGREPAVLGERLRRTLTQTEQRLIQVYILLRQMGLTEADAKRLAFQVGRQLELDEAVYAAIEKQPVPVD